MRHEGDRIVVGAPFVPLLLLAQAPPPGALGMIDATDAAALIPLPGIALALSAHRLGARPATVALAAVAAAAQHDLLATASAKEQATDGIDQAHSLMHRTAEAPRAWARRPS
ncbi:hypothetical protein EXH51_26805 [Pelomonas saccharophila]|nr:hypothetical protein [Roseateles saccharophilus]